MGDKATRSHIETLRYVDSTVKPGDSISHCDLEDRPTVRRYTDHGYVTEQGTRCTLIEATACGDYSGNGLVAESNYRTLLQLCPWLVEVSGSHGYSALAYLGKRENQSDALIEAIDSLASYPVLDESDHSELEMETVEAAWQADGREEFKHALVDYFAGIDPNYEHDFDARPPVTTEQAALRDSLIGQPGGAEVWRDYAIEHDLPTVSDALVDTLWYACVDRLRGGEGHLNEQGDRIYFPINPVIRDFGRGRNLGEPGYYGEPSINEQLQTLCAATRGEKA